MKFSNPVLLKELKLRFRFFKSVLGLLFYLITLLVFVYAYLTVVQIGNNSGYIRPTESFYLFLVLSVIQTCLVLFITPGITAGAISTEREKQTLNMLLTTTQSSWQIILGKLTSSIAYLGLLLIAALPIYSIVFLFGGVSPGQLVLATIIYFLTMVALGSCGVMISTLVRKTIPAMITTYGVSLYLIVFSFVFFLISTMLLSIRGNIDAIVNPIGYFFLSTNPIAAVLSILSPDLSTAIAEVTGVDLPVFYIYIIFCIAVSAITLTVATKKLRVNMKKG